MSDSIGAADTGAHLVVKKIGRSDSGLAATRAVWREVLDADPNALVSQTPEWFDAIREVGSFTDASRLYVRSDGRRLVLPMLRSVPTGVLASNPGGWGPGGLVSEGPISEADLAAVLQDLTRFRFVKIRPSPDLASSGRFDVFPGYETQKRVAHIVDLSGGFDTVWKSRFPGRTRTKIRKAARSGVEVHSDSSQESLAVFVEMYDRWLTERAGRRGLPLPVALRLGRRREPKKKVEAVRSALGDRFRFWVARLEGVPVAATTTLFHGRSAVYWRGYSSRELAGRVKVNYLLQQHMIEAACEAGCESYNMGDSGGVASLMHFKESFGAKSCTSVQWVREPRIVSGMRATAGKALASAENMLLRSTDVSPTKTTAP